MPNKIKIKRLRIYHKNIDLRVVELKLPPGPAQRESLASASRFAQFFYWMLESRHPLIWFGIPGIVFFWVGFEMANELISFQGPHDSVSLGVALAAFAATLFGVFSLTASDPLRTRQTGQSSPKSNRSQGMINHSPSISRLRMMRNIASAPFHLSDQVSASRCFSVFPDFILLLGQFTLHSNPF